MLYFEVKGIVYLPGSQGYIDAFSNPLSGNDVWLYSVTQRSRKGKMPLKLRKGKNKYRNYVKKKNCFIAMVLLFCSFLAYPRHVHSFFIIKTWLKFSPACTSLSSYSANRIRMYGQSINKSNKRSERKRKESI
jgi:hypothetical protein